MTKPSTKERQLADPACESITEVTRLQQDMLTVLQQSSIDPISYAGLTYCSSRRCGRVGCSEACAFGARRRRIEEGRAVGRLLGEQTGKLYQVDVARPRWERRYGDLYAVDSAAGKRLVRRVLDGFGDGDIVAVGTFKVRPFGYNNFGKWLPSLHLIVAGAKPNHLRRAFDETPIRVVPAVIVNPVENIGVAVDSLLSCNEPARPVDRHYLDQRQEFYAWLLNMEVGARLIRYGCDEEFRR
jgi:hypothetical protein